MSVGAIATNRLGPPTINPRKVRETASRAAKLAVVGRGQETKALARQRLDCR